MLEIIVAMDHQNGLSKNGTIPWHIPEDMAFFREKTMNHVVIMGKKTFDSLPKGALKNRLNIVITRTPKTNEPRENVIFTDDIHWIPFFVPHPEKYPFLKATPTLFVIGGSEIYHLFFSQCTTLWITYVNGDYDCDVFFKDSTIDLYRSSTILIQSSPRYSIQQIII
jgi:dihydrofolate reductase